MVLKVATNSEIPERSASALQMTGTKGFSVSFYTLGTAYEEGTGTKHCAFQDVTTAGPSSDTGSMPSPLSKVFGSGYLTSSLNATPIRLTRNTSIVSRDVAGETIVVPICRGVGDLDSVYTFNPVGRSLWRLLENGRSVEELANWVVTHYEVDAKQAVADVQSYLSELEAVGLVRTV
jgi:hypothetical protein